jgi:hypothetical protein
MGTASSLPRLQTVLARSCHDSLVLEEGAQAAEYVAALVLARETQDTLPSLGLAAHGTLEHAYM